MVVEVKNVLTDNSYETVGKKVFYKSIELLGGLTKLMEYRTLTWLPSLARASFVLVLKEDYFKTEEEIASIVGLTKNTVKQILRADPSLALKKIQNFDELTKEEKKDLKVHTAGGLAKLAYKMIREGNEPKDFIDFASSITERALAACELPWAYNILRHTKGIDYPIKDGEVLKERLKDVEAKGVKLVEIIPKLNYPVKNPAELLHEIKILLATKS